MLPIECAAMFNLHATMPLFSDRYAALLSITLLTSCAALSGHLRPAWQQDSNLTYQGQPAAEAQHADTPHLVARACYAEPQRISQFITRLNDVPDAVRGLCSMGDGTLALGFSDVTTGRWLDARLCGGQLLVGGQPGQAYSIHLQNKTPLPLDLAIGIDGKDITTGQEANWRRSTLRLEAKQTIILNHSYVPVAPFLFRVVQSDYALFDTRPKGSIGLIQVAAWLSRTAPSLPSEKIRRSQFPPLNLLPVESPEQYR